MIRKLSHLKSRTPQSQTFDVSGVWTHPEPGVPYGVSVRVIGGGAGGGSGGLVSNLSAGSPCKGGNGGSPGEVHDAELVVTDNVLVIVGAGGVGGGTRTFSSVGSGGTNATGLSGSNGGYSAFGPIRADGGTGGAAGVSGTAAFGTATKLSSITANFIQGATTTVFVSNQFEGNTGQLQTVGTANGYGGGGGVAYRQEDAVAGANGIALNNSSGVGAAGQNANTIGGGGSGSGGASGMNMGAGRTITTGKGGDGFRGQVTVRWWRLN